MSPMESNPIPAPMPILAPVDRPSEPDELVELGVLDDVVVVVVAVAVPVLVPVLVSVAVAVVLLVAAEACARNAASPTVMVTPVPAQLFSSVAYTVARSAGLDFATQDAVL